MTAEPSPSLLPHQRRRTLQPGGRVGAVIDALRRFDVVEKFLVDHRLPGGGDRRQKCRGAGGIRAGQSVAPLMCQCARTASTCSAAMRLRKAGWSSKGWPMPLSPQSSKVSCSAVPRKLPGWKSPCTSVSGNPHDAISAKRLRQAGDKTVEQRWRHRPGDRRACGRAHRISPPSEPARASRASRAPAARRAGGATPFAWRPAASPSPEVAAAPPRKGRRRELRRAAPGRHHARAIAAPAPPPRLRECGPHGRRMAAPLSATPSARRPGCARRWTGSSCGFAGGVPASAMPLLSSTDLCPGKVGRRPAGLGIGMPQRMPIEPPVHGSAGTGSLTSAR